MAGTPSLASDRAFPAGCTRDLAPRIFTHGGGRFGKCRKIEKRYEILLEMDFSLFLSKKHGWKRDMGHSWRYSKIYLLEIL
jgi:hypothetical protein